MEGILEGKKKDVSDLVLLLISLIIQAVQFRRDQMPVMNYSDEVIVFNDKESLSFYISYYQQNKSWHVFHRQKNLVNDSGNLPQTFDDHIIDFEAIMIFFTGTGCSTCQDLLASYKDTARDLFMWEPHISMGQLYYTVCLFMACSEIFYAPSIPHFGCL